MAAEMISDQGIERLEELAKKATPGPWHAGHLSDDTHTCNCRYVLDDGQYLGAIATVSDPSDGDNPPEAEAKANLLWIALANPSTILSIIQRLRDAEAMVADAYQFAGNILDIAGLFEHPEGQRALDYFSRGKADPEWRWPKEEVINPWKARAEAAEGRMKALRAFAETECSKAEADAERAIGSIDEDAQAHAWGRADAYAKVFGRIAHPTLFEDTDDPR